VTPTAQRALFTTSHAAEYLDISPDTLRRLVQSGELRAVTLPTGGARRYARDDLDALVARLRRTA
jgi:excisionase family DNA binding protein